MSESVFAMSVDLLYGSDEPPECECWGWLEVRGESLYMTPHVCDEHDEEQMTGWVA